METVKTKTLLSSVIFKMTDVYCAVLQVDVQNGEVFVLHDE